MQPNALRTTAAALVLGSTFLSAAPIARANPEPPALQDARSSGMAGAAVAYNDSGTGVFHNPAVLDSVDTAVATVSLTLFRPSVSAPIAMPNVSVDSENPIEPILSLGGVLRVHDRVAVGVGAAVTSGIGGQYELMGETVESLLGTAEIVVPVIFKVTDQLAIAAGPRLVAARADARQPDGMGGFLEQELDGVSLLAAQAGVLYRPLPDLNLGFAYRSKVTVGLEGTTTLGPIEADTEYDFSSPHTFRLGAAYWLMQRRLMLTGEVIYQLYSESNDEIRQEITLPPMGPGMDPMVMEQVIDLGWNNTFTAKVGAEYFFTPAWIGRAGYHIGTSSTPESNAGGFVPAPGLLHSFHLGGGFRHDWLEVDLAILYALARGEAGAMSSNGPPGDIELNNVQGTLSVTYRHPGS